MYFLNASSASTGHQPLTVHYTAGRRLGEGGKGQATKQVYCDHMLTRYILIGESRVTEK